MDDPAFDTSTDLHTQSILLAAAHHDIGALRDLLRNTSANVQDEETGFTPLHAAIAALEPGLDSHDDGDDGAGRNGAEVNGHTNGDVAHAESEERKMEVEAAVKTVRFLFENGAIWNDLDANGETPGCIAHRLGLKELYDLCVDAGVRAELLLSRLDEYQPLDGDDSDYEEEDEGGQNREEQEGEDEVSNITEKVEEIALHGEAAATQPGDESTASANYLASNLTFQRNRILDGAANGVMMGWETTLMRRSAELLTPREGLRVLNVGHGIGIIDAIFQERRPTYHHIIEAHPDVLEQMKEGGWYDKPGVVVHQGRWQDIVPGLVEKGDLFDAIYFDTFAEDYRALREFFTEYVIGLLDPAGGPNGEGGRFGFFCGMGADRQVCYDVYCKVVEMDLFEAGFDTEWETIPVPDLDSEGEWEGVRRKYWVLKNYKLPTCSFIA
ncbi:arginine N-methyltransferas-like protein [Westerdykella ornata]|uniref:Arginine N-methyltransferase 2 n=1 Tax=Westerdykella ornata TaxID=318751 RepID=A0A6A6JF15_WESOR|nr:arginine N-methyltransferas-like protein [Westerdykella ornata]KAF2274773.1 arginine N-methyltransferas-like protein [Westerdykella ornata]